MTLNIHNVQYEQFLGSNGCSHHLLYKIYTTLHCLEFYYIIIFITCVAGVQISNCVNGSVDIAEDTSPSFTCGTIRSGWINWLADDLHIGSCNKDSCILKSNIYKLRSESSSAGLSSELTITKIDRFTARRLVCLYTGTECRLRVFGKLVAKYVTYHYKTSPCWNTAVQLDLKVHYCLFILDILSILRV